MNEFRKVLSYILAESDIKEDEVKITQLAPTVRENVKIYHVKDGEYIDFYAEITISDRRNNWGGEHLAVVHCYGEMCDDTVEIYRVDDGYLYDVISTPRADK